MQKRKSIEVASAKDVPNKKAKNEKTSDALDKKSKKKKKVSLDKTGVNQTSDSKEAPKLAKKPSKKEKTGKPPAKQQTPEKKSKFGKQTKPGSKFQLDKSKPTEKPEDWNKFKKERKELKQKRKQQRAGFDYVVKAKQIGEKLRCKILKGGPEERNKLINELHSMLKGQKMYEKFVLAHDTSRVVQWLLKYSSVIVKEQISQELLPVTIEMLHSKYGIHCAKRLLKYGNPKTKSAMIQAMYGHVVKLTCHNLSAPVFEYGYTQCATPLQKKHSCQEFFGDMYKNSKDDSINHLRDVYKTDPEFKKATLSACKANLFKAVNSGLMDSTLVQTVLHQFFTECSPEDKSDLLPELIPHIVVISNSKDGSRVAMQALWFGTNKDRKLAMKTMKEHIVEMSKHEHAHCTVITLLDTADDTVVLHKIILSEILKCARDLAVSEWGRKVLLWLVAPADSTCFHPVFIKELEEGRAQSTSKKDSLIRRKEILEHSVKTLLQLVVEEPEFWLKNSSLGYEMWTIVKAGAEDEAQEAITSIVKVIADPEWKIKINDSEVFGIEDAGLHMIIKKLIKHNSQSESSFATHLAKSLTAECLEKWLTSNRGCFVLVTIYENSSSDIQKSLRKKLKRNLSLLEEQKTQGAKILSSKIVKK